MTINMHFRLIKATLHPQNHRQQVRRLKRLHEPRRQPVVHHVVDQGLQVTQCQCRIRGGEGAGENLQMLVPHPRGSRGDMWPQVLYDLVDGDDGALVRLEVVDVVVNRLLSRGVLRPHLEEDGRVIEIPEAEAGQSLSRLGNLPLPD